MKGDVAGMKKTLLPKSVLLGIICSAVLQAQNSPLTQIAVLNWNRAVVDSVEGKQATAEFQKKYESRRVELNKLQEEIQTLQKQLNQGGSGEGAQAALTRQIDAKSTALKRAREDSEKEFSSMQNEILSRISKKILPVVNQFAQEKNISVIIDSSNQAAQLVYYDASIEITDEVIKRFDAVQGSAPGPAAASTGAKPPVSPPVTR